MEHLILIHGTWCTGETWQPNIEDFEAMGFVVHTPTLRGHQGTYAEVMANVGEVSLADYVEDIVALCESLAEPAYVLGHSLGGLIAQLVAEKIPTKGLILLGTAPAAGIYAFYPSMIVCFYQHFLRWGFWKKPMPPYHHAFCDYCMNQQAAEDKEVVFKTLVPESGKVYFQMAFPFFDKERGATVHHQQIRVPVLVITGTKDKMVHPNIARATAKKYVQSELVVIEGSDHMYLAAKYKDKTIAAIRSWYERVCEVK